MSSKDDWTMSDWRNYFEKLRRRAEDNYQESGITRYSNEEYKYSKIVDAFDGYLEYKSKENVAKKMRQSNIDAIMENELYKDIYTRAEVARILGRVRNL